MGTYTVTELGPMSSWDALEGAAPGKKFVEGDLGSQYMGLSVNATQPGASSPFWHAHSKLEEIYVFLEGSGELAVDDDTVPVGAGTIVRVGQGVWHGLRCLPDSPVALKWLCFRAGDGELAAIGRDAELDRERPWPWA